MKIKKVLSICLILLTVTAIALPAFAGRKDKDELPELNKKRSDPDYILEKYEDIYKTTDYGGLTIGPPFVMLRLAGIDLSQTPGRTAMREILQSDPLMFPLRIYIVDEVKDRYNEKCAVFVIPELDTTLQEMLLLGGLTKASDHCLDLYPYYTQKFKRAEQKAQAEGKGIWQ